MLSILQRIALCITLASCAMVAMAEPVKQRQFCALTQDYAAELRVAEQSGNDIKVNMVRKQRQEDMDALLPQGTFEDWVVSFRQLKQVADGSSAILFSIDSCGVTLGSGTVADGRWEATIKYGDRQYREAAKLSRGDKVLLSGRFFTIEQFDQSSGQPEPYYAESNDGMDRAFIVNVSYLAKVN